MRWLWIGLLAAAVLTAHAPRVNGEPTPASNTRKPPTQKELDQARAHFRRAEAAKNRSDYQTAVGEYLTAYQLFPEPEFLFNAAEVYRLASDEQNALAYFEKYLELDPQGRGAATARTKADQLRQSIAVRQAAARRAADDETRRSAEEAGKRTAENEKAEAEHRKAGEAHGRQARNLRLGGLVTASAGVVSLGIGAAFGLKARRLSEEVSNVRTFDEWLARSDEGRAADLKMQLFTSVGAAALLTGGLLYYVGHRAGQTAPIDSAVTFAPAVTPSQITLTAVGRF